MGGFHIIDILIVALIGLAIFGPKALQSMARNAGKGVGQAKQMKDELMSDLSLDEMSKVTKGIPQLPMNSHQAMRMLMHTSVEEEPSKAASDDKKEPKAEGDKKAEAKSHEIH